MFINAWNEWAEGTHLKPDKTYATSNLEPFLKALAAHFLSRN